MKHAPKLPLQTTEILFDDKRHQKAIDVSFADFTDQDWKCPFLYTKFKLKNTRKFRTSMFVYLPEYEVLVNPYPEKDEMYVVPYTMSFDELVLLMKKNGYFVK